MHPFIQGVGRRILLAASLTLVTVASLHAQRVNTDWSRLAIKGYDPVAYFTEGRPVLGDALFESEYAGAKYRFTSATNRDRFKQDPLKYVPQYGGYCAYAVSRNYTADIDPLAWRIVDGKLYLNYNRKAQQKWEEDVPGNIRKGDTNWPSLSQK
jgi:YHS domain-containing protein